MADGKFLDFFDMIDGGGAGQMGDKFEGGGLLSLLGNMLASPYGSQDEERRQRLMQMRGLLDVPRPINRPKNVPTVGGGTDPRDFERNTEPTFSSTSSGKIYADPRGFDRNTQPTFSSPRSDPSSVGMYSDPRGFAEGTEPTYTSGMFDPREIAAAMQKLRELQGESFDRYRPAMKMKQIEHMINRMRQGLM